MAVMAQKPLMLKDYLELDDDDDDDSTASSSLAGATTIRRLVDAELRGGLGRLVPTPRPNKNSVTMFSAAINAVKLLPFSSDGGCLPTQQDGCLSKRLRGGLWKKKTKAAAARPGVGSATRVKDIVTMRSLDAGAEGWRSLRFPSPVASSRSSWSEADSSSSSSGSDFLPTSIASSESPGEAAAASTNRTKHQSIPSPNPNTEKRAGEHEADARRAAKEFNDRELESSSSTGNSNEEEEKQQLSPVSVIDYQQDRDNDNDNNNDDDDKEVEEEEVASTSTSSPNFYHSLANIERTTEQLRQRIRRFEMLAELDPTSAEEPPESAEHVASSDAEEEETARGLLGELRASPLEKGPHGSVEKLLLDFFIQGQSRSRDANRDRPSRWGHMMRTPCALRVETREMLSAARDWIDGRRCRDLDDRLGEATLRDMERNGRWRCFDEEEEELATHLEGGLFASLVKELIQDLAC